MSTYISSVVTSLQGGWTHWGLKLLLTVGVFVALVVSVDLSALTSSLRQAHWGWAAAAGLLLPVNLFLDGWVWAHLLRHETGPIPPTEVAGGVLSGMALGFWTPAQAGEYAGRSFYLTRGDRGTISLTVFAQRMVDMAIGIIVGGVLLVWALSTGRIPATDSWLTATVLGGTAGGVLTLFILNPAWTDRLAHWLFPERPSLTDRTALFRRLRSRDGFAVVGGSLVRYVVFTGQFVCLGLAFAPSASVGLLAVAVGLTYFAKYLLPSLTVLDLGIREGGAVFFFEVFGLSGAAGLNAALLLFILNIGLPALLGLPFVSQLQLSPSQETSNLSPT